jgi:hypothetical protein
MRTQSAVAVVSENSDTPIEQVSDRRRFLAKIADYQHQPKLFVDIETIDWRTPTPCVALLQDAAARASRAPASVCGV